MSISNRRGGSDGNLIDDITSLRFQTLAGTLMYSRSDRDASAGYDIDDISGPNSGVLMVSLDEPTAIRSPATTAIRTAPAGGPSTRSTTPSITPSSSTTAWPAPDPSATTTSPAAPGHDQLFGQLGNDIIQGDGTHRWRRGDQG